MPDCLIAWLPTRDWSHCKMSLTSLSRTKIVFKQIRHQLPAWSIQFRQIRQTPQPDQSCSGKLGKQFRPDQSCPGKSGKPPSLINPTQANQALRQRKEICEKSALNSILYTSKQHSTPLHSSLFSLHSTLNTHHSKLYFTLLHSTIDSQTPNTLIPNTVNSTLYSTPI